MKKPLIIACVCGLLIVAGVMSIAGGDELQSRARRAWKDKAVAGISAHVADQAWAGGEIARLKQKGAKDADDSEGWLSDGLILMRNGDWLAYASICQKQDRRIHDLFIGRGSDGRWYFSTYHFCKGMSVLRAEDQSEDLAGFAKAYYLRAFDGHSNECLQRTWPPDSR